MEVVEYLLDLTGIGRNRMQLRWVSSAEGQLFADYVTQYSDQTRDMGPFETDRFQLQLSAARRTLDSSRIRWLTGMDLKLTEEGNVYNEKINKKEYTDMLHKAIGDEYEKALVLEALGSKPQLVREISQKTELPVYAVSSRLVELKTDGLAEIKDYDGAHPLFIRLAA